MAKIVKGFSNYQYELKIMIDTNNKNWLKFQIKPNYLKYVWKILN